VEIDSSMSDSKINLMKLQTEEEEEKRKRHVLKNKTQQQNKNATRHGQLRMSLTDDLQLTTFVNEQLKKSWRDDLLIK
jgi:hypothetical protein